MSLCYYPYLASYLLVLVLMGGNLVSGFEAEAPLSKACVGDGSGEFGFGIQFGLRPNAYEQSCPEAETLIFARVEFAISKDPRMAASLLRLHFHDCFVNGCDGSVLLDDTSDLEGEKTAGPNLNSLRGFEVIDSIKSELEFVCPETVSCADVLAIAARDAVVLSGGPAWEVETGRRDSLTASKSDANNNIPGPNSTVETLISKFENVGLTFEDVVSLSGAHTLGMARCATFTGRLAGNNLNGAEINPSFLQSLQQLCSRFDQGSTLARLDAVSPATFDNQYYVNLLSGEGLLPSDQVLTGTEETRRLVETYVEDAEAFFEDFKKSMVRMGGLSPLIGRDGEIRRNCRSIN